MKEKHFAKAYGLANRHVEAIAFIFDSTVPDFDDPETARDWYELEGERLERALSGALPGGVYDQLLGVMLRRRGQLSRHARGKQ